MPFYDKYSYSYELEKYVKIILEKYPDWFPDLTKNSDKIDDESEQILINCALMLMDGVDYSVLSTSIKYSKVAGSYFYGKISKAVLLAQERREAIKKLLSELDDEHVEKIIKQGCANPSKETREAMSIEAMMKFLAALVPPLHPTELKALKKFQFFAYSVKYRADGLLRANIDLFFPKKRDKTVRNPVSVVQTKELIDSLFEVLDEDQMKEMSKNEMSYFREPILKYIAATKNEARLKRLAPYVKETDHEELFEYALNLKNMAALEKILDKKSFDSQVCRLMNSDLKRIDQFLDFAEIAIRRPDLMKKIDDEIFSKILSFCLHNDFIGVVRKLIFLYPERLTPEMLESVKELLFSDNTIKIVFKEMCSAQSLGFDEAHQWFTEHYPKEMEEQRVQLEQNAKEAAAKKGITKAIDLPKGPTIISHKLFAHIQNDHEASGTELQGGHFLENTAYLLTTLGKMQALGELPKEDYEKLDTYFSEVRNWALRIHALQNKAQNKNGKRDAVLISNCQEDIDTLNNEVLKALYEKGIARIPGGYAGKPGHAMLYELILEKNGEIVFKIVNTGAGLVETDDKGNVIHNNHLSEESAKIVRYAPMLAYRFPATSKKDQYLLVSELLNQAIRPQIEPLWHSNKSVKADTIYENFKQTAQTYGGEETPIPGGTDVYIQPQHSGICSWKVLMAVARTVLKPTKENRNYADFKLNLRYHALLDEMARLLGIPTEGPDWDLLKNRPGELKISDEKINVIALHQLRQVEHGLSNYARSIEKYGKNKKISSEKAQRAAFLTGQMNQIRQMIEKMKTRKLELVENQEKKQIEEDAKGREEVEKRREEAEKRRAEERKKLAEAPEKKQAGEKRATKMFKRAPNRFKHDDEEEEPRDFSKALRSTPLSSGEEIDSPDLRLFKNQIQNIANYEKRQAAGKGQKESVWKSESIKGVTFFDKIKSLKKYITSEDNDLTSAECVFAIEQCLGETSILTDADGLRKEIKNSKEKAELLQTILTIIHEYNLALSEGDNVPYAHRAQIGLKLRLCAQLLVEYGLDAREITLGESRNFSRDSITENPFYILLNEEQQKESLCLNEIQESLKKSRDSIIEKRNVDGEDSVFHDYARSQKDFVSLMMEYGKNPSVKKVEEEKEEREKLGKQKNVNMLTDVSAAIYYFFNAKNGKYPEAALPPGIEKYTREFDQLILLQEINYEITSLVQGHSTDIYHGPTREEMELNGLYSLYSFKNSSWQDHEARSEFSGKKYLNVFPSRNTKNRQHPRPLESSYEGFKSFPESEVLPQINQVIEENSVVLQRKTRIQRAIAALKEIQTSSHKSVDHRIPLTLEFMKTHFDLLGNSEVQLVVLSNLFRAPAFHKMTETKPEVLAAICEYITQGCQQAIKLRPMSEQGKFLLKLRNYMLKYLFSVKNKSTSQYRDKLLDLDQLLFKKMDEYSNIEKPSSQECLSLESIARSLMVSQALLLSSQGTVPDTLGENEIRYLSSMIVKQQAGLGTKEAWSYDKYLEQELMFRASTQIMEILNKTADPENKIKAIVLPLFKRFGIQARNESIKLELPYVSFEDYAINLQTGVLTQGGHKYRILPSEITTHYIFEQYFGKGFRGNGAVSESETSARFTYQGSEYQFNIIALKEAFIKKKLKIKGQPLWYTFCDLARTGGYSTEGMPLTLFDKRFEYWVYAEAGNQHMVILENNEPRYYFDSKNHTLALMQKGEITPYILQNNKVLERDFPDVFFRLGGFEDKKFIEVYRDPSKVEAWLVKLPRYNLSFAFENGKWVCQERPEYYLETLFKPTHLDRLNACLHFKSFKNIDEERIVAPRQRFRKQYEMQEKMLVLAENEYKPIHLDRSAQIYEENDCVAANNKGKGDVSVGRHAVKHRFYGEEQYAFYRVKDKEVEVTSLEEGSHLAYLYMGLRDHQKAYEELRKISLSTDKPKLETFENLRRIITSVPEVIQGLGGEEEQADQSAEAIAVRQLALSTLFTMQARFPDILKIKEKEINEDDLSAKTTAFQNKRTVDYVKETSLLPEWLNQYTYYLGIRKNIPAEMQLNEETERMMLLRAREQFDFSRMSNVNYRYHQLQLTALVKMKKDLLARPHSKDSEKAFVSQLDNEIADHQSVVFKQEVLGEKAGKSQREVKESEERVQIERRYHPQAPLKLEVLRENSLRDWEKEIFGESFEFPSKDLKIAEEGLKRPSLTTEGEADYLRNLKEEVVGDLVVGATLVQQELLKATKAKAFFTPEKLNIFGSALRKKTQALAHSTKKAGEELIALLNKEPPEGSEERLAWDLAKLGRTRKTLALADAFDLFLQNDMNYYQAKTGLTEADCRILHQKIYEYLQEGTHKQHLERMETVLRDQTLTEPERQTKLGVLLTQERAFNPWEHPDLLLFEYCDDKRLSRKQADYLGKLSGPKADPFQTVQLIMGGGKSKILNPLLAMRFADGLHLAMLVVPQALLNTNFEDLSETTRRLFGKNVHLFTFNRDNDHSLKGLKKIESRFLQAISAREPIITTPESLQSLELKYLELLALPHSDTGSQESIKALGRILLLLKNRTVPIVDEVDKTLSVNRQLNYTLGEGEPIEPHLCQATLDLYVFMNKLPLKSGSTETLFDLASGKVAAPPKAAWEALMATLANKLCVESESPLKIILSKLNEEEKKVLKDYLTEKQEELPGWLTTKLDARERDVLALYKEQLCRILPETLLKKYNVHYGVAEGTPGIEAEIAIPYDNGAPNLRSRFANYIISMNYTIQLHFNRPLTDSMLRTFLRPFAEKIGQEKEAGIKRDVTREAFEAQFGLPWQGITDLEPEDPRISQLFDKLRHNKKVQTYCLEKYILPEIKHNKKMLSSNAQSFVSLFSNRFLGFSGTDWNYRCYHPKIVCQKEVSRGTDGQTLYHLLRKESHAIYDDGRSGKIQTEGEVMARMLGRSQAGKTHAFIDLGAWGATQSNINFVHMEAFQAKLRENKIEFILYFDENKLYALSLKDGKVIPLLQTDKHYIQKQLNATPDKWFTYYDAPHTVGIDIAQAENARGILSLDKQSTLRDLLQAVMRMRKLSENQQIDYLVPEAVRKFYPDVKNWNLEAILKMVVQNQVQRLSEDILVSSFHKMDDMLREKVMEKLLSAATEEQQNQILKEYEGVVCQLENQSCYKQYGGIDKEKPVKKTLEEKKEKIKKMLGELLKDDPDQKLIMEQAEKNLNKIITDTVSFVRPLISNSEKLNEQQNTTEIQKQAQKEIQKDVQKESEKEQETMKVSSEEVLEPLKQVSWGSGAALVNTLSHYDVSIIKATHGVEIYPIKEYLSSKNPGFEFDNNIYVSENFAKTYKGQPPQFDSYVKNIHYLLNVYNPVSKTVKMTVISIDDTIELDEIIFGAGKRPENIWIESSVGDVYCGTRPESLPKAYYNQIQQINYLAGNLGYLYEHLQEADWLQQDVAKKMDFYQENLARIRDARPQIVEMLTSKVAEHSGEPARERKREAEGKREVEADTLSQTDTSAPLSVAPKPVTFTYGLEKDKASEPGIPSSKPPGLPQSTKK